MQLISQHFCLGVQDLTETNFSIPVFGLVIAIIPYVFCSPFTFYLISLLMLETFNISIDLIDFVVAQC
jgi:hypothetical protein